MMASWKPRHVVKHYLKLQTYFINCVVTVFHKEIYLINTTECIHWKLDIIGSFEKLSFISLYVFFISNKLVYQLGARPCLQGLKIEDFVMKELTLHTQHW
jgi:hypothetical protein